TPSPLRVANDRVVKNVVGQVGTALLDDQAELRPAVDRHATEGPVGASVQPGGGPQFQDVLRLVDRPDAGEGRVHVVHQRLGAGLEDAGKRVGPGQGDTHVGGQRRQ